jgi:transcription initiation factor IIF auxiliary subunit
MALSIAQDFTYQGDDYWKWWVWIEGSPEELDHVDYVMYTLHPTFPNPVRTVRDRASKFRLDTAGWGIFRLYAMAAHKDGTRTHLDHELKLLYPNGTSTTA